MTNYGQVSDWLPFALFTMAAVFSFIGALASGINKLWNSATFFAAVFAVSVASIITYGI